MTPPRQSIASVLDTRTADGRKIWTCAACGKRAPWDGGWRWYGNYTKDGENVERVVCSSACAGTSELLP